MSTKSSYTFEGTYWRAKGPCRATLTAGIASIRYIDRAKRDDEFLRGTKYFEKGDELRNVEAFTIEVEEACSGEEPQQNSSDT